MRDIKDFIAEYLNITETAESPTSYLKWGAISCLSAVLRDNVWFYHPERMASVYPNLYVLILGETSAVRKSTPFGINENLLRGTKGVKNTKVIGGEATMQGVLKTLAMHETGDPPGGSGILIARELAGFFISDPMTIPMLTNLYEYAEVYDKHVASYQLPPIKGVCLSLFAGTNEPMMQALIDKKAKTGGFLGRCIVIAETQRRHKDSGFEEHGKYPKPEAWDPMYTFLRKLSQIKGPLQFSEEAKDEYNRWYHRFNNEDYNTQTGYEWRIHTHIQKLAVVLSAAKSTFFEENTKIIGIDALHEAIELCMNLLTIYKKMTFSSGISPTAQYLQEVIKELMKAKNYHATRMQLLMALHGNVTGIQLDEIMKDLEDAGFAKAVSKSGVPGWQLTEKWFNQFKVAKHEKSKQQAG